MEKEFFSKEIFDIAAIILIIILCALKLRMERRKEEEMKWMAKIIAENPSLSEEELVEKIKFRFLTERLRSHRPLPPGMEMKIKERIKQHLKEIRRIQQSLKDYQQKSKTLSKGKFPNE